jgi:hypothetical protein
VCDNPNCGPHILALDEHERCMAEIVIGRKDIASFCRALQNVAYEKAVKRFGHLERRQGGPRIRRCRREDLEMKHVNEQELISAVPTTMDRKAKLLHWAEILRKWPYEPLVLYHNLEYTTARHRQEMLVESHHPTAFGLACKDPAFQAQGLPSSTSVDEVGKFFDLTLDELHEFSCDCGGAISKDEMADRLTSLAARR